MELEGKVFSDLPASLVADLLQKAEDLGEALLRDLEGFRKAREAYRRPLEERSLLRKVADLPRLEVPTVCGVDGSFVVERLVGQDFLGMAAVAVEGLTPPSEKHFWPEPHHADWVGLEAPSESNALLLRAYMIGTELQLAAQAPHDVILLDGSLTTPLIYFNQALNQLEKNASASPLAEKFVEGMPGFLEAYRKILSAEATDQLWAAVPKRTTHRELGQLFQWPEGYEDRGILSMTLEAGEYVAPIPLQSPEQPWHLNLKRFPECTSVAQVVLELLYQVQVVYYRPSSFHPVLRLEIPAAVANHSARLAQLLQALYHQCPSPKLLEPYPLYLADRMVKSLSKGIKALRSIATRHLAERYPGNLSEVFLMLHSYRTEID